MERFEDLARYALIIGVAAVIIPLQTARAPGAEVDRSGILSVRLESDKSVYHLGDPIELRATLHNNAGEEYGVRMALLCDLQISTRDQTVPVTGARHYGERGMAVHAWSFAAGKSLVVTYVPVDNNIHEWTPLDFWSYKIGERGTYTIVAVAQLTAWPIARGGAASFSSSIKSNAVGSQIVK